MQQATATQDKPRYEMTSTSPDEEVGLEETKPAKYGREAVCDSLNLHERPRYEMTSTHPDEKISFKETKLAVQGRKAVTDTPTPRDKMHLIAVLLVMVFLIAVVALVFAVIAMIDKSSSQSTSAQLPASTPATINLAGELEEIKKNISYMVTESILSDGVWINMTSTMNELRQNQILTMRITERLAVNVTQLESGVLELKIKVPRGISPDPNKPSAHIEAVKKLKVTYQANTVIKDWSVSAPNSHLAGDMKYNDGNLTVPIPGRYYIYAQFYYHSSGRVNVLVNNRIITMLHFPKGVGSLYTGGVFNLKAGDVITLTTPYPKQYSITVWMASFHSYFGAFLI